MSHRRAERDREFVSSCGRGTYDDFAGPMSRLNGRWLMVASDATRPLPGHGRWAGPGVVVGSSGHQSARAAALA